MINEVVVEQHAEEAAFLWGQRDRGVYAPNFRLKDLARWDERVEAHLDGLRIAGESGWRLCEKALETGGPGEVFAAAILALGGGDCAHVEQVLKAVAVEGKLQRGFISALGWLPWGQAEPRIRAMLRTEQPSVRRMAIGGCAVQRRDPGPILAQALADPDAQLRARALKSCGELGRADLLPAILRVRADSDYACGFYAAWSAARLGDRSTDTLGSLRQLATSPGPFAERALDIALRIMDLSAALEWQRQLSREPKHLRQAAIAAGTIGDPALVANLMGLMRVPNVARIAGAAFALITGVDLAYHDLDAEPPAVVKETPNEQPKDDNVGIDRDKELRWPWPDLVAGWWRKNVARFTAGRRYLLGQEIGEGSLRDALATGYQPQRAVAALELGLRSPATPLFEVRARAGEQSRLLGHGTH